MYPRTTAEVVIRPLGSAPRASSASTNGSRRSGLSPFTPRPPASTARRPWTRYQSPNQVPTSPEAAWSAGTPSMVPFGSSTLLEEELDERVLTADDGER